MLRRTGSIGFAVYPFVPDLPRAIGWEEVVDLADAALYAAKRNGRNLWVGLEAGVSEEPETAVQRFREAPEGSLERGELRAQAPHGERPLRWA